jgi:hypothetical protein
MSNKVIFLFPFEGPTTSIKLPQPSFGNGHNVNYQIQTGHSRSGNLFSYKRTPTYQTHKLTFDKVREASINGFSSKQQILDFLQTCAGQRVRYLDHQNQNWWCVITTPAVDFTNQGKDQNGDLFGFSLEFEGSITTPGVENR